MSEKLCVFCIHLKYNTGGYGEYADPANLECGKGHKLNSADDFWQERKDVSVYSIDDFRKAITTAKKCKDYERPLEP